MATKKQQARRIEYRPLDDIQANPRNPKAHDVDTINDSVNRFGYIDGVVIDERTGYLISGHGRTKSLRAMRDRGDAPPDGVTVDATGAWLVPVQVGWASRTDAEAEAALIALNRTTELGGWVDESLLTLLDGLDDHTGVGYTGDDIEDLRTRLNELTDEPVPTHPGGGTGRPPFEAKDLPGVRDLVTLHHGDCIEVMRTLPAASVDAIVTDPPYGLGFMGKEWDDLPPGKEWAEECLRVLKPGGHVLAFGGSRTWHRLAVAVEDAGFEIRDSIAWLYGSGFPKSLDVSKAIDKAAGAERAKIGVVSAASAYSANAGNHRPWMDEAAGNGGVRMVAGNEPATPDAERWQGWGTALKPAFEPVVVGRKPLDGTVAANVLTHGTGALNIDGCRVGDEERQTTRSDGVIVSSNTSMSGPNTGRVPGPVVVGRWPANVVLDESQAAELDQQSGESSSRRAVLTSTPGGIYGNGEGLPSHTGEYGYDDAGGASRYFPTFRYEPKAPTSERPEYVKQGAGTGRVTGLGDKVRQCNVCETRAIDSGAVEPSCGHGDYRWESPTTDTDARVAHPTVKPLDLMRWLVRLVTPPGGTVLEPFAGSGTTLEAAVLEGFACIGIEREASYLPLIRQRLGIAVDDQL